MDEISPSVPSAPPSIPDSPPVEDAAPAAPATPDVPDTSGPSPVQADLARDSFSPANTDTEGAPAAAADQARRDAERPAGESATAQAQRAALASINGASGFDGSGTTTRGVGAPAPAAGDSTTPRKEIDMTPKVYGSPEWGPGYTVTESERAREERTDGKIQGADGRIFEPEKGKGIDGIPPVQPSDPNKVTNKDPVLAIYGVFTNAAKADENNKALADAINRPVVGVRNATTGLTHGQDLLETLWDQKTMNAPIPSTKSAADIITDRLAQNRPLDIHAHSQGAVVASQAIDQARQNLITQHGLTPEQADERMKLLNVTTYGGAAAHYNTN
ncbi:MAG TPA: hypothetical protein VND93_00895, partial [Myxococcales bacterium]|nr:hypothetical protein [Myxococcales bacterium]